MTNTRAASSSFIMEFHGRHQYQFNHRLKPRNRCHKGARYELPIGASTSAITSRPWRTGGGAPTALWGHRWQDAKGSCRRDSSPQLLQAFADLKKNYEARVGMG